VGHFATLPPPVSFTARSFALRLAQHAIVYTGLLVGAICGCVFIFAPVEASFLMVGCIAAAALAFFLLSSSGQRVRRLVEGGLAASYVAGAGALLKAINELWHWLS
jgi:hypothetical protein